MGWYKPTLPEQAVIDVVDLARGNVEHCQEHSQERIIWHRRQQIEAMS
jgi:hypothetical protein